MDELRLLRLKLEEREQATTSEEEPDDDHDNDDPYERLVRLLSAEDRARARVAWDCHEHSKKVAVSLAAGAGGSTVDILDKHIWR